MLKFKNKKGMSIAEVVISVGIFSFIMLGLAVFFGALWKSRYYTEQTGTSLYKGYLGVNKLVNSIREARQADNGDYAIDIAESNRLVIFTDFDNDGAVEKVCYQLLASDELERRIIEPIGAPITYADCSNDLNPVIVSDNIVNDAGQPVFSYFDNQNNLLAYPLNIGNIRMIKISLLIDDTSDRNPEPVLVESYVSIRNLTENDRFY